MALFDEATRVDNRLQERSKLIFEFPTNESNATLDRVCPFFENPIISEKKVSNLIKYDVLGRTSNFIGYTGAKSKQFSVQFDMTLPHIVNMATNELFAGVPMPPTKLQKQDAFFTTKLDDVESTSNLKKSTYEKKRKEFIKKVNGGLSIADAANASFQSAKQLFADGAVESLGAAVTQGISNFAALTTPEYDLLADTRAMRKDEVSVYAKAIDIMLFWIELMRMSCLTSGQQPTLGPPIIRLRHGVLYDNISTVLENYSINIDESAGYDLATLLPQRIKISLNLLEIQRNQDPRRNIMTDVVHLDELKGWDTLLLEKDPAFKKSNFMTDYYTD